MFLVSIVTLISSTFVLSNALVLECEYKVIGQWTVFDLYHCDNGRIIFVGDPNNVTEVTPNHVGGRRNEDVDGLKMKYNQNLSFLPRNINHFFPNLKSICVQDNLIEKIQQSDISVFPELIQLDLYGNRISSLDFNLFQKNSKIKKINFSANPLQHIGPGIFDHLTELDTIAFPTFCHYTYIYKNRTEVLNELPKLARNCPPTIDMLKRQITGGEYFEQLTDQLIAEKISPLTNENSQLRQELNQLRQELTQLRQETIQFDSRDIENLVNQQIAAKISPLTKENSQLRQELNQLRQELTQLRQETIQFDSRDKEMIKQSWKYAQNF